ncbi:uncharacterized protein LOC131612031 [Vicia villosa]|uniref:uncharacterized protein LOC131612031 n=1 Tax=Vicia villosa TaxID=3911 RepID=UPI00273B93A5|nr:uncharacterized protein LOC131612031 [Vicia villosa]
MEHYQFYRSWMYDRMFPGRRGLKPLFMEGVAAFLSYAFAQECCRREGGVRCPCLKCGCRNIISDPSEVKRHLERVGFRPNYWVWTSNRETMQEMNREASSSQTHIEPDINRVDPGSSSSHMQCQEQFNLVEEMFTDALGVNVAYDEPQDLDGEELPNEKAQRFYQLLKEINIPLFEGSSDSKLSMCVRLLAAKSNWNVPDQCLEFFARLMLDATPVKENMPTSYYDAKRVVSKLGLEVKKIDCCIRGCMLFYDNEFGTNDGELEECKFCESPRYLVSSKGVDQRQNRVAAKSMFYLPIIPRLQRMFASMHSASQMAWHHTNRISSGMMRHPSDGEAWKHFDRVHPEFALEPRNVRLGLCSDGFTPYNFSGNAYSCWPVIVTPYNLPPEMCMTKPYMFLTCIIPGPSSPKAGIDVYLQPLIDDLKRLWVGAWTYDVSRKQNFNMRAALMWTINDFPAYGMLSGWGTHGKMGCPHCMNHTKAFTLDFGGKSSWFDCHRRFLPTNHEFRRNKDAFRKGIKVKDLPPPRLSSTQVWNNVCDLPKFTDYGEARRIKGYGVDHNWTKRSIFWDLPYWKDNLLRHNLDVMHIEKNFFDNVLNTVMDNEKTKDNEKARKDMELYCNRKELELKPRPNGKLLKPKACYTLTPQEAKAVCRWLNELRMPDGYSSNLARCADANTGKLHGMKSHDCHIFMERLLPIAFSSLPKNVLNPLTEISQFFRDICASTLRVDDIIKLDRNIPVILCKLEQIFPPGFFDSMEHLPVHLAYEAFLGGPVQYRWMYPFERFMGDSKRSVKNKARVEGSICAHYIHRETSHFCSHYFNHMMLSPRIIRNEVNFSERSQFTLSVFGRPGRPAGKKSEHWLSQKEMQSAHVHVLINCVEVKPYLEAFGTYYYQSTGEQPSTGYRGW